MPCGEVGNWSASIRSVDSCAGTSRPIAASRSRSPPPLLDPGLGLQRPQRRRCARRGRGASPKMLARGLVAIRLARLQRELGRAPPGSRRAAASPAKRLANSTCAAMASSTRPSRVSVSAVRKAASAATAEVGEVGDDGPQVGEALIDEIARRAWPARRRGGWCFGRQVGRRWSVAASRVSPPSSAARCPSAGPCRAAVCPARWSGAWRRRRDGDVGGGAAVLPGGFLAGSTGAAGGMTAAVAGATAGVATAAVESGTGASAPPPARAPARAAPARARSPTASGRRPDAASSIVGRAFGGPRRRRGSGLRRRGRRGAATDRGRAGPGHRRDAAQCGGVPWSGPTRDRSPPCCCAAAAARPSAPSARGGLRPSRRWPGAATTRRRDASSSRGASAAGRRAGRRPSGSAASGPSRAPWR